MIIRVGGGSAGIAEYLEEGVKNGRDYTRDELDDRLILDGDLNVTNALIKSMETKNPTTERYLHITLAFKEDHIPENTLNKITQEFKEFAMSAYKTNEYDFYAEAHLPRIKSITDKRTGEQVERKPHIHIVIPKVNLETGKRLAPFELVEIDQKYIDAFQEVTNEKYGLASPKVHIRTDFTNESTFISRSKGDHFKGTNREIKETIFNMVVNSDISSMSDLKSQLITMGWEVKERNQGKENAYFNIKQKNDKKGINLNDSVFKTHFVSLSTIDKKQIIAPSKNTYTCTHNDNYKAPKQSYVNLDKWKTQRSYEVRYLHSGNRAQYKKLSSIEKVNFIQHKISLNVSNKPEINIPKITNDEKFALNVEMANNYLKLARTNLDKFIANPNKPKIRQRQQIKKVISALFEKYGMDKPISNIYLKPNITSQNMHTQIKQGNTTLNKQQTLVINKYLNANLLLQSLSKSHGIATGKYIVTQDENGSDRIKCGNRNLNMSDFLTKEINLSWKEAKHILLSESTSQKAIVSIRQMKTVMEQIQKPPVRSQEDQRKYDFLVAKNWDEKRIDAFFKREKDVKNLSPKEIQRYSEIGQKTQSKHLQQAPQKTQPITPKDQGLDR